MVDESSSGQSTPSGVSKTAKPTSSVLPLAAINYARQAEKLSHLPQDADGTNAGAIAVRAEWITPQDPIIITANGGRLPTVPLAEAIKLNELREEIGINDGEILPEPKTEMMDKSIHERVHSETSPDLSKSTIQKSGEGSLRRAMAPSRTNPLFPPLPLYGPPSTLRDIQCMLFRISSSMLSLAFLGVIVLGSIFSSIPLMLNHIWLRLTGRHPDKLRPFCEEEERRRRERDVGEKAWARKRLGSNRENNADDQGDETELNDGYVPTEGGPDPLICDAAYYARRVGLDIEEFKVQTEDGFIINLWHVYDPREFTPLNDRERDFRGPDLFTGAGPSQPGRSGNSKPRFPILMMHGLLQSAGAYCTNDDSSFAFYLCKSGYDVWLGNNRCGFKPEHTLLNYADPRMWAWNIRQMGVMDLPALISRVLSETGFEKLGLICHSQGTTETFVALAKEQRPDLGEKITVFCALAPAAYAGPLIGKMYFKFMRVISPALFRMIFGIHAFIPFMMTMHATLDGRLYGALGYRVFSFLFNWTDTRWELDLRDRMFQFAPVYVSAESMRWWLGRECFATQKCILSTREEGKQEDVEDEMDGYHKESIIDKNRHPQSSTSPRANAKKDVSINADEKYTITQLTKPLFLPSNEISNTRRSQEVHTKHQKKPRGSTAWYDSHCPPFALWICGSDDLVDGRRLLRRFDPRRGREPHVRIVHSKIIEEYEHLDVIWAIDAVEQVGKEVKEVLWKTAGRESREKCRVPLGCEEVGEWLLEKEEKAGEEDGQGQGQNGENSEDDDNSSSDAGDGEDAV